MTTIASAKTLRVKRGRKILMRFDRRLHGTALPESACRPLPALRYLLFKDMEWSKSASKPERFDLRRWTDDYLIAKPTSLDCPVPHWSVQIRRHRSLPRRTERVVDRGCDDGVGPLVIVESLALGAVVSKDTVGSQGEPPSSPVAVAILDDVDLPTGGMDHHPEPRQRIVPEEVRPQGGCCGIDSPFADPHQLPPVLVST